MSGASDLYFLRVADAVLSGGDTGSPLTTDAVGRGWFVEEATPGGSDLNISLQWNDSEEQAGFDRTNAYVSHFLAGSWDTQPTSAAVGADPYTLSRSGVTVVSPFAVFAGDFLPVIDISGIILWEHDGVSGVKNTSVALSGDNTDTDLTPADGTYTLSASNGSSFTVTPTKNINKLNGITVADAMAIQQHVTQSNPITSPYKQVAADVNKSNSITTFDATVINQALLGNPAALAQIKTSWRFVPMDYSLPLPPWGFPEKINLTGVNGNVPGQDFFGIKTGDVVDTYADPANLTVPRPLVFQLNDQVLQAGAALNLGFRAGQFDDLAAWQFALRFDPAALQLTGIKPGTGSPALTTDHFGTYNISEGEIRSVWSQPAGVSVAETGAVFHMKFQVLESGRMLSEVLRLDESALPAYAYNSILEQTGVTLRYDQATHTTQVDAALLLGLQVQPNPFVNQTQVMFRLPEAADVQLRVLDAGGRELFRIAKTYSAGYQQETIRLGVYKVCYFVK
ncbi:MAG: hypothetical protein IPK76_03110 [Lewinellaceae bacterium]|nr:hypothetical protein [Lewinellaceae bacterium]